MKDRAEHLEKVVRGEAATVSSEEDITEARAELERLRQQIRQEENQTYGIRVPESHEPAPEPESSRSEKQAGTEKGAPGDSRQRERGVRPGPTTEERSPERGGQTDGQPNADDILNKYL